VPRRRFVAQEIIDSERARLAHGERYLRKAAIAVFIVIVAGLLLVVYFVETPQRLLDSYVKSVRRAERHNAN